jgi:hypothetical protein
VLLLFTVLNSKLLEAHTLLLDKFELTEALPTRDLLCVKLNKELDKFSENGEDFSNQREYSAFLNADAVDSLIVCDNWYEFWFLFKSAKLILVLKEVELET